MSGEIEIAIDFSRCSSSRDCRLCLEICPQGVLAILPKGIEKFKEASSYLLHAPYRGSCTGCGECEKICPSKAISLKLPP
jgi:NAD-dependent dihydropyrimidine dehydrogenase PreA subunit